MSEGPTIIVKGEPREPEVAVVAHRAGQFVPMTPKHFSVYSSHEEAIERARIYVRLHPAFARKWAGWHLATVRVDDQVEVTP